MIYAATTVDFGNPVFLGALGTVFTAIVAGVVAVLKLRPENTRAIVTAATELVAAQGEFADRLKADAAELRSAEDRTTARMSELEAALVSARDELARMRRQYEDNIADLERQLDDRDARLAAALREIEELRAQIAAAPQHPAV